MAGRPAAGLHLDSAACSRQSFAVLDATARHEAEVGGYIAAEAATPVLNAGRAAVAVLAGHALDLLLSSWPPGGRTLACLPGEFGPNLALMAVHGFACRTLPTDGQGRVALGEAAISLADDPPDLVHLTAVASHRGVVQPLQQMARLCSELGLPLVVDAAQALGQADCCVGVDAAYASSRKWMAGPRGVGVLAVHPTLIQRLRPRLPPPDWAASLSVAQRLELGRSQCGSTSWVFGCIRRACRVGPSGGAFPPGGGGPHQPDCPRRCARLAGSRSGRRAERHHHAGPVDGADPQKIRAWLIADRRIVAAATAVGVRSTPTTV